MTNNERQIETIIDELGTWILKSNGTRELIEPSLKFLDRNIEETVPEPTQEDYLMDLDYRISIIELGL